MTEAASGQAVARLVRSPRNMAVKPIMMAIFVKMNRLIPGIFRWLMRVI
jgi:hypothetical protein